MNLPTFTNIEPFSKAQIVSRTINAQWATQKDLLMLSKTSQHNDTASPNEARWYSEQDGDVHFLYVALRQESYKVIWKSPRSTEWHALWHHRQLNHESSSEHLSCLRLY